MTCNVQQVLDYCKELQEYDRSLHSRRQLLYSMFIISFLIIWEASTMVDYTAIKYEKNFLRQVIIRLDYLQFLDSDSLFSADLEKTILKSFPRREMTQRIQFNDINVALDQDKTKRVTREGLQKQYYTGKNKLTLTNKFIIFDISEYSSFNELLPPVTEILHTLFSNNIITSSRVGIRYINIIDSSKIKIRKNMFSPSIAAILGASELTNKEDIHLLRAMGMNEYEISRMTLNFRYGLFNPDYPNILSSNSFSLDFDCYTSDPFETEQDIVKCIIDGHDSIQELFEASIAEPLRKVMGNGLSS